MLLYTCNLIEVNKILFTLIHESNHGSGVCKEHFAYYYVPRSSILLAGTGIWKIYICSKSIKIDYSDYPKSLISRIIAFYVS